MFNVITNGQKFSALQAALFALTAYSLFAIGDTMGKWLQAEGFDKHFILIATQVPGLIFFLGYMLITKGKTETFKKHLIGWHCVRALSLVSLTFFLFLALEHLPLADFYAIGFTSPFITAIGAWLFFKERQTTTDWVIIIIGFMAILLIAQPSFDNFNIGYLYAFLLAASVSSAGLLARKIGEAEHPFVFVIYGNAAVALSNFVPALSVDMPDYSPLHIMVLMAFAILSPLALIILSMTYTRAPRLTSVFPFIYVQIIWGAVLGYFIFDDIPTWNVIIGAIIIIGCGLFLLFHNRKVTNHS
jgi:S-adenosylmethionine uptake transporter